VAGIAWPPRLGCFEHSILAERSEIVTGFLLSPVAEEADDRSHPSQGETGGGDNEHAPTPTGDHGRHERRDELAAGSPMRPK
jgi:hypothetical protein